MNDLSRNPTKDLTYTINPRQTGNISTVYSKQETDKKFQDMHYVLTGVTVVILIMVATLIIDSFHINAATYKEYSEKINTLNFLKDSNKELLEQNKQNQELIIELQKQLLKK